MITINTDRLTIRESSGRDFSRIYAMLLSETGTDFVMSEEMMAGRGSGSASENAGRDEDAALEKYLAYIHTVYPVFGFGLCTVEVRKTGEIIGWCGLQPIGDEDSPLGRIELGYLIDRNYRNRGYGYEACRAILDFAFRRLELDEVWAVIDEKNVPSLRLAEKLGFTKRKGRLWAASGQ